MIEDVVGACSKYCAYIAREIGYRRGSPSTVKMYLSA